MLVFHWGTTRRVSSLNTNDRSIRTIKFDPNWLGAELKVLGCCVEFGDAYKFVRNNEYWKHFKTKVFNQVRNAVAPDQWFVVIGLIGDAFIDGSDDCRLYPILKNYIVNSLDFSDCDEDVEERFYQHVFNALSLTGSKINHSADDRYVYTLTFSPILITAINDDFQNICDLYQIDPGVRCV